jgi:biopolymer transport protein ExbD
VIKHRCDAPFSFYISVQLHSPDFKSKPVLTGESKKQKENVFYLEKITVSTMNIRNRLRARPEVHTGALNDILFILLLFFLIVSTLANPNVIKVSNPKAKSDTKSKQTVVITVDKDQNLYLGQKKVTMDRLEENLKAFLAKETVKPSVVINGDSTSHLGTAIKVMQVIKRLGATPVMAVDNNGAQ